jgi:microcystin-dependent protein
MSQQTIDTSTQTDLLFQGFEKVNENFTEVYAAIINTGMMIDYWGSSAPSGWVFANGETIGDASSGATGRANADTEQLFALLWESLANAQAPVSGGRGSSAADDFAAHKTITLPDVRGRVSVGKNSSGTFTVIGDWVGSEIHTLSEGELPVVAGHNHIIGEAASVQAGSDYTIPYNPTGGSASIVSQTSGGFGSGTAHNNIQPSITCNKIIKL